MGYGFNIVSIIAVKCNSNYDEPSNFSTKVHVNRKKILLKILLNLRICYLNGIIQSSGENLDKVVYLEWCNSLTLRKAIIKILSDVKRHCHSNQFQRVSRLQKFVLKVVLSCFLGPYLLLFIIISI